MKAPRRKWMPKRRYLAKPGKLTPERERIAAAFKEYLGDNWISGLGQRSIAERIAYLAEVSPQAVRACVRDKKFRDAYFRPFVNRLLNRLAQKSK